MSRGLRRQRCTGAPSPNGNHPPLTIPPTPPTMSRLMGTSCQTLVGADHHNGAQVTDPKARPLCMQKRVPNPCSPPVRVLSRQVFRQCFVAWLGVVCRGAACFYSGFRGPCLGPLCGLILGPTASFAAHFANPFFGTMVLGSLIQGHRIMNRWPSFVVHKTDPKVGPLTQRLGP